MTPLTLDASGAVFQVKLDTHTAAVDLDVASSARLRINDVPPTARHGTARAQAGITARAPPLHHTRPPTATVELASSDCR